MEVALEKKCKKCGLEKPFSDFSRRTKSNDGLQYWCRLCILATKTKKLPSQQVEIMMSRQEIHSADVAIEQRAPILDPDNYDGELLIGEKVLDAAYADELLFNEDPVVIRIEPGTDMNASRFFPVWVNGKGAEVFRRGRWESVTYLPTGEPITVRRKVLETILRAKVDKISNEVEGAESDHVNNRITRFTTSVVSVSLLQDPNPRGGAWMTEIIRRNM